MAEDLTERPADPAWRRALAPELSYGRHAGPARPSTRLAAVVAALCWDGAGWVVPLTVRASGLSRHGGQVSLPGGLVDANEDSRDAACRELSEELGLQPPLEWLGDMAPLLVFASDALVTPCVAAIELWPPWQPQPGEVDRVLRLPVAELVEQPPQAPLMIERWGRRFAAPRWIVEGESVWGATAVVLAELRGRVRRLA